MIVRFSNIQYKIVKMLSDGMRHTKEELATCLTNGKGPPEGIEPHITSIRKQLRPLGQDIICEVYNRKTHYRHVILLPPTHE
jgi:hypothetical protein